MTKYISIYLVVFLSLNCNSQISIDTLLSNIKSDYTRTGTKDYLGVKFTTFETVDKKDRYDLYLDSTNYLKENIGLSIVHYTYDEQHRIILIEGFNSKGIRSYWDFPEVQKFRYVIDTVIPEMNTIRNEICNCEFPDTLSNLRIVEEINSNRTFSVIRYTIYSKDSLMKLTFAKTSDGSFYNYSNKTAYIFREFDTINTYLIIHERYYDSNLNLVMGEHNLYTSENVSISAPISYAYSIRIFKNGSLSMVKFHNKRGKLIQTENYGDIRGPISN